MNHETTAAAAGAGRLASSSNGRPVIFITPDIVQQPGQPTEAEYVVRTNYAEAVTEAGGIPLILPYQAENLAAVLALADGVLVTGTRPGILVPEPRQRFERGLVEASLAAGKPVLGICHGMQLVGECLGGRLVTELPADAEDHMPRIVPDQTAHEIVIEPGSQLASCTRMATARVNSLHRHTLAGPGRFRPVAHTRDGIIEAFEGETPGFCLGVQWHPEYRLTDLDTAIFKAFIRRSAKAVGRVRGSSAVYDRLGAMGLAMPEAVSPPGAFVGAVRTGSLVTISGQVPLTQERVLHKGQLGAAVTLEEGRACAQMCLLNALAQLEALAGGFASVCGFVRLAGYVSATADFEKHGAVIDGASELLRALFPDRWQHARIAIGVASLPRGVPVEIELTAVLDGEA